MPVYRAVHTGPNTAFGGFHDGFFSFVYLNHSCLNLKGYGQEWQCGFSLACDVLGMCGAKRNAPSLDRRFSQEAQCNPYAQVKPD